MKNFINLQKKFALYLGTFLLFLNFLPLGAIAQETKLSPQPKHLETRVENSDQAEAVPNVVEQNSVVAPATEMRPTMVLVLDVSLSVTGSIEKMRNVAKQAIELAPENTIFGIVPVGSQASKHIFKNKAEAISYLDQLSLMSLYTDLGRGTDAVLSVLQEVQAVKPTLVVYLTDGKVSLPKEFKDKADFREVLIREFSQRPDFSVLVLNVAVKPMDVTGLPPNVKVIPLSNWGEAEREMKNALAARIQEQLTAPTLAAKPESALAPTVPPVPERPNQNLYAYAAGTILLVTLIVGAVYWLSRRRKKDAPPITENNDEPVDMMRSEDLQEAEKAVAPPTALLEFQGAATSGDGRRISYETLLAGEKRIVGKSSSADLSFACLRQPTTLEFRFDGEKLMVFRLRPLQHADIDELFLNESEAPLRFVFQPGDSLHVNGLEIKLILVDEEVARLMTQQATVESENLLPVFSNGSPASNRRFRGRRQIS